MNGIVRLQKFGPSWKQWCAIVSLIAALPAGASTLLNGDFETGSIAPWFQDRVFSEGEDWAITSDDARSGTYSITNTGNFEIRQNFTAIAVEDIIAMSFWAKHLGGSDLAYIFFYMDGSSSQIDVATNSQDWEFFDIAQQLTQGQSLVGFSMFGNSTGCDAMCTRTYIDDVNMSVVPIPAAVWLFASAMGFLGFLRKAK